MYFSQKFMANKNDTKESNKKDFSQKKKKVEVSAFVIVSSSWVLLFKF